MELSAKKVKYKAKVFKKIKKSKHFTPFYCIFIFYSNKAYTTKWDVYLDGILFFCFGENGLCHVLRMELFLTCSLKKHIDYPVNFNNEI